MMCEEEKSMPYFDSHAHLSDAAMLPQIDAVMKRAKEAGVTRILNICTDPATLKEGLLLAKKFPEIANAGSTTPHDVEKEGEECFEVFKEAAKTGKIVAVGETGLEYFYKELDRTIQKKFLVRYLHLAQETKLPVIFHCREAFADLFAIADLEYAKGLPAVLHCFSGTMEEAERVISRGWFLSLSGVVTYKKNEALRLIAKWVPLNQLLVETDTPYLAPQSRRGKPNEPAFLVETVQVIADAKGISRDEVARVTFANAAQIF